MAIGLEEVVAFAEKWFHAVQHGADAKVQATFHRFSDAKIIAPDGSALNLEQHAQLHAHFQDEKHEFGPFELVQLASSPERVKAAGTVYWEARYRNQPDALIKAVVGELWILERNSEGHLKFILYWSSFFHLLPGSAPVELNFS